MPPTGANDYDIHKDLPLKGSGLCLEEKFIASVVIL